MLKNICLKIISCMPATTSGKAGPVDSKVTLKAQMNDAFSLREKTQLRNPTKQFQDSMATVPLDAEASRLFLGLTKDQQKVVTTALAQQGITVEFEGDKVFIIGGHDLAAVVKNGLLGFPSYLEAGSAKDIAARADRVKEIKKKDIEYSDYFEEKPVDVSVLTKDALYYLHTISQKDKALPQTDFELNCLDDGEEPSDALKKMASSKNPVDKYPVTNPTQLNSAQYLEFLSKFEIKSIVMPVQKDAAEDVSSVQQLGNLGVQGACDMHLLYQDKKTGKIYTFAIEREVWTGLESVESKGKVQHPLAIGKLNAIVQKYLATLGGLDEGKAIAGLAKKIVEELFEEGFACNGKFKLSASDSVTQDELTSIQRSPDNHKILEFKNNEWVLTMDITSKEGQDALEKTLAHQFPTDPAKQKRITEFLQKKKSEYQETKAKHVETITQIIAKNMVSMGMRANVTDDRANARLLPFSEAFRVVLDQSQVSILKELAQSGDDASGLAGFVEFDATKFWSDHGVMQLRSILDACIDGKMQLTPAIIQQCKKMGIGLQDDFYAKLSPVSLHVLNEVNKILDATTSLDRSKIGLLVMMLPDIKALDHDLYQQALKTIETAAHNPALKFTPEQKEDLLLLSLESSTFSPDKKTLAMIAKQVESGKNELFLKLLDGYRQYPEKPLFKNFDQYIALNTKMIMAGYPLPEIIGKLWSATPQSHQAAFLGHLSAVHPTLSFSELVNKFPGEPQKSVIDFWSQDNNALYTQIMTAASNPNTKFTTEIFNALKFVDRDNYATALDNMREAFLNKEVSSAKRDIFLKEMQKAIAKASGDHQVYLSRMYMHLAFHHEAAVNEFHAGIRVLSPKDVTVLENTMLKAMNARLTPAILKVLTEIPANPMSDANLVTRQLKHLIGDRKNPYQPADSPYQDSPFLDRETGLFLRLIMRNNPTLRQAFPREADMLVDFQSDFMEGGSLAVSGANQVYIDQMKTIYGAGKKEGRLIFASVDMHDPEDQTFSVTHGLEDGITGVKRQGRSAITWPKHCVRGTDGQRVQDIGRTDMVFVPKGHEDGRVPVQIKKQNNQIVVMLGNEKTQVHKDVWLQLLKDKAIEEVSYHGKTHIFLNVEVLNRNAKSGIYKVTEEDDTGIVTNPKGNLFPKKLLTIATSSTNDSYSAMAQESGRPNALLSVAKDMKKLGLKNVTCAAVAGDYCTLGAMQDFRGVGINATIPFEETRFVDNVSGKIKWLLALPDSGAKVGEEWKKGLTSLLGDMASQEKPIDWSAIDTKAFAALLKANKKVVLEIWGTVSKELEFKCIDNLYALKSKFGLPSISLTDAQILKASLETKLTWLHLEKGTPDSWGDVLKSLLEDALNVQAAPGLSDTMKAQLAELISKNTKQIWGKIEEYRKKPGVPDQPLVKNLVQLMKELPLDANAVKFKSKVERLTA